MSKSSWDPNDAAWHQRWLNVDPRSSFFITMQIFVRVAASVFSKFKNLEKNLDIVIFEILAQPRARQTIWGEVKAEQKIIEQILHTWLAIQIYSTVNFLLKISSFKFGVHLPQMQNSLQVLPVALKFLSQDTNEHTSTDLKRKILSGKTYNALTLDFLPISVFQTVICTSAIDHFPLNDRQWSLGTFKRSLKPDKRSPASWTKTCTSNREGVQ